MPARTALFVIAAAALAAAPANAKPASPSSGRQDQVRGMAQIPVCTRRLGTLAIVEPERQWWRELNLGSPEAILKIFVQRSGCFGLVNRGRSMQSRAMERALADNGELQAGSNVGRGQVKTADYFLEPDIVSTNKNSGGGGVGGGLGGAIGGLFGGSAGSVIGGLAGGISVKKGEANVTLSIVLGTLMALLLVKVSKVIRLMLMSGLVLVWAMPVVVAVQVWYWMTNFENGVLTYVLSQLHIVPANHDWYATPVSQLAMVTLLIVWGALPFVVITVYAGLAQVPDELVEAAEIDGAGPLRIFRDVTFPVLKPILLILTSLSIIWDFGIFTQPFLLIDQTRINTSNELMGIYLYEEGYVKTDFGRGAAISILMLLIVAVLSIVYVRRMVRTGDEAA